MADDLLLDVKDLQTIFTTYAGTVRAVDGVSFHLNRGEAIAIVGESGCGKSVTALSIMRLVPDPGRITRGAIMLEGVDLVKKSDREMQHVRGNDISMIFQDPMTALNPVLTIGLQMTEVLQQHQDMTRRQARKRVIEMLDIVGIPNAASRVAQYPHQFSGGMRQRVMIGMALSCNPKLLIADEPSTSLDVTIQAQILDLMRNLRAKFNSSIILITHDLAVVAGLAQRVLVMYAGQIIEHATVRELYYRPQHPYAWALLKSVPRLDAREKRRLMPIIGQPPDLIAPPAGCRFNPRCAWAMPVCLEHQPEFTDVGNGHYVACWLQHPSAPAVEALRRGAAS
jgi:oligopeptide transport system ATP-binding protein